MIIELFLKEKVRYYIILATCTTSGYLVVNICISSCEYLNLRIFMTVTEHMLLTWGLYRESEQALTYHSVSRLTYLIPPRAFYLTTVESSSIVVLLVPPSRASISSHREHVIPLSTFTLIEHVIRTSSSGHFILPGISSYQAFHPT